MKLTDEQVRLFAELIAGLQVPRSFGAHMLGTATKPYDLLRASFRLFGWQDAKEIEEQIRRQA